MVPQKQHPRLRTRWGPLNRPQSSLSSTKHAVLVSKVIIVALASSSRRIR